MASGDTYSYDTFGGSGALTDTAPDTPSSSTWTYHTAGYLLAAGPPGTVINTATVPGPARIDSAHSDDNFSVTAVFQRTALLTLAHAGEMNFCQDETSGASAGNERISVTWEANTIVRIQLYNTVNSVTRSSTGTISSVVTATDPNQFFATKSGITVIAYHEDVGGGSRETLSTLTLTGAEQAIYEDGAHRMGGIGLGGQPGGGMYCLNYLMLETAPASVGTIPSASTLSSVVSGSYQVSSEWSSVLSVTGYRLEKRGPSDATFSTVSSTETSTFTSYLEGGLTSGSTYTYAVVSFNTYGDGPRSSVVTVVTDPGVVPSASTLSSIPLDTSRTSSEWSSSDSVVGYKFQRQGPSDATLSTVFSSTSVGYIDTGLTSFSSYTYGVVSYNTEGDGVRSNLVALRTNEVFTNSPGPDPSDPPTDPWTPTGNPFGPGAPGSFRAGTAAAGTVNATTGGPWARAYPQSTSSDGGVDYELQARQEFAFSISSDRPHAIVSSISEGRP